jgi:hypothetical protein
MGRRLFSARPFEHGAGEVILVVEFEEERSIVSEEDAGKESFEEDGFDVAQWEVCKSLGVRAARLAEDAMEIGAFSGDFFDAAKIGFGVSEGGGVVSNPVLEITTESA